MATQMLPSATVSSGEPGRPSAVRLAGSLVGPTGLGLLLGVVLPGPARAPAVVAGAVSGVWLVALGMVASRRPAAGPVPSRWAPSDLRALRRRGWTVLAGSEVGLDGHVDHLAVGPAGVWVLESRWSSHPWPAEGADGLNTSNVAHACWAAQRNRERTHGRLAADRGHLDVGAVVVLHSPATGPDGLTGWYTAANGTVVCAGRSFPAWLAQVDRRALDPAAVRAALADLTHPAAN